MAWFDLHFDEKNYPRMAEISAMAYMAHRNLTLDLINAIHAIGHTLWYSRLSEFCCIADSLLPLPVHIRRGP